MIWQQLYLYLLAILCRLLFYVPHLYCVPVLKIMDRRRGFDVVVFYHISVLCQ
uniref:Uncharacterized protein n=1 Tax=Anguilla anguilla TaxID=7936 RepID=A0A0E9VJ27_ANGAN